tara:strand:- start:445 stop:582 length:138 start_codon:yes stop_codon:yes gene_type:complete
MNKKEIKQLMKDKIKKDTIKIGSNILKRKTKKAVVMPSGTVIYFE